MLHGVPAEMQFRFRCYRNPTLKATGLKLLGADAPADTVREALS